MAIAAPAISQVVAQRAPMRPRLWSTDDGVCVLTFNPTHAPLALPAPYTPPSIAEMYGEGVTEDDLFPGGPTPANVGANIIMGVAYGDGANEGFNHPTLGAARRAALSFAMGRWEANLQGPGNITINATMTPRGGSATSAVLASAAPANYWKDFPHVPVAGTWYPEALTEIISGTDPDTGTLDINLDFNSDVDNGTVLGSRDWYYGTDANPGSDFDFVTVTIHELNHGLGFISSFNSAGQWGGGTPQPFIYDRFLVNGAGTRLISLAVSSSNVTGNNVFWNGLKARFAYNNFFGSPGNVPIFAPTPWNGGSSISHLDEATFTGVWDLQTPNYTNANHQPDSIVLGILQDIGYSLPKSRYVDDNASGFEEGSSGNPFNTVIEGVNAVPTGGHVRILPGTYPESMTITKAMFLHSCGGAATIGPGAP